MIDGTMLHDESEVIRTASQGRWYLRCLPTLPYLGTYLPTLGTLDT